MSESPLGEADSPTDQSDKSVCTDCGDTFGTKRGLAVHRGYKHEDPWKDKDILYHEYVEEGKTRQELADQWGCAEGTIQYWQEKHNIERRDVGGGDKNADYRDKEILERLYHEEDLSMTEMAECLDCSLGAIQTWMDKHGIERDKAPIDPTHPPWHGFVQDQSDSVGAVYEEVQTRIDGTLYHVPVHRLVAVSHGIIESTEFFDEDINVHHTTKHGLDNRPQKLERMTRAEHSLHHRSWENSPVIPDSR